MENYKTQSYNNLEKNQNQFTCNSLNNQNQRMSSSLIYMLDVRMFVKFKHQLSARSAKNDLVTIKKEIVSLLRRTRVYHSNGFQMIWVKGL